MSVPAPYNVLNATEFSTASQAIQMANAHITGVINGCVATESSSDMVVTVGPGTALIGGAIVAIAGGDVTIVSNPTNLRWSVVYVNAAGAVQVANGDPAPNPQTEPSIPNVDGAAIKYYKVQAGQTVANNITIKIHKYVQTHPQVWVSRTTAPFTKNVDATLADVPGLSFPIGAGEVWAAEVNMRTVANGAGGMKFAFTVPSGATVTGTRTSFTASGVTTASVDDFTSASGATTAQLVNRLTAYVVGGAAAGVVQLSAAQNASHTSDSIIHTGSTLTAWRVA